MAVSPSHKLGQLIGDFLEKVIEPHLRAFANDHNLFLDIKGKRIGRKGVKLTWTDGKDNKHDLDFVLERGGTAEKLGEPVAFIETAWRRYTKHSRNKAQEIQGAIIPLIEKYQDSSPFTGAVLAGKFTGGSLTQLTSQGFAVLFFEYETVVEAFAKYGLDIRSEENSTAEDILAKIKALNETTHYDAVAKELLTLNNDELVKFMDKLTLSVTRKIESIVVWPLHGIGSSLSSIDDAIKFINDYTEDGDKLPVVKYEIIIKYNTATLINATCASKAEAIDFLQLHARGRY